MASRGVTVPRRPYVRCRDCKASAYDGVTVSSRGYCPECAGNRLAENAIAMSAKQGPTYEKWARNTLAALQRLAG